MMETNTTSVVLGNEKKVHMFLAVDSNYGSKSPGVVGPLPNSCLKIAYK